MRGRITMTSLRYLDKWVLADLERKMVFLGGPRQVGKTTLAKGILATRNLSENVAYRNWDILSDRKELLQERLPMDPPLIVLDEIHKDRRWKGRIKGLYDVVGKKVPIIAKVHRFSSQNRQGSPVF